MEIEKLNKHELKEIIKQGSYNNGTIYFTNGKKYKIDIEFIDDFIRKHAITKGHYGVDRNQIEWLSSKQDNIKKTTLPNGVIVFDGIDIGVIYPKFFVNYKNFKNLEREDSILLLKNLRTAILNNEELLMNGIYNQNLLSKNILYKDEDVQLIDLDGKYIKKEASYSTGYEYFLKEMYKLIDNNLRNHCRGHASEYSKRMLALQEILKNYRSDINQFDCPRRVLKTIEKENILR